MKHVQADRSGLVAKNEVQVLHKLRNVIWIANGGVVGVEAAPLIRCPGVVFAVEQRSELCWISDVQLSRVEAARRIPVDFR